MADNVLDKIKAYIDPDEDDDGEDIEYDEAADILDRMYDLITSLDPDKLTDKQAEEVVSIINDLADEGDEEDEEERNEGFAAKRVKISPAEKRKRRQKYRKKRAQIKVKAKRYRRTAGFKKWKRKTKIKRKAGKTATGARIRKFI